MRDRLIGTIPRVALSLVLYFGVQEAFNYLNLQELGILLPISVAFLYIGAGIADCKTTETVFADTRLKGRVVETNPTLPKSEISAKDLYNKGRIVTEAIFLTFSIVNPLAGIVIGISRIGTAIHNLTTYRSALKNVAADE